jgi:hypothetical protein
LTFTVLTAKAAAGALYEKSAAAWKTVSETKNPAAFFSFSRSKKACSRPSRPLPL